MKLKKDHEATVEELQRRHSVRVHYIKLGYSNHFL